MDRDTLYLSLSLFPPPLLCFTPLLVDCFCSLNPLLLSPLSLSAALVLSAQLTSPTNSAKLWIRESVMVTKKAVETATDKTVLTWARLPLL